MIKHSGAEGAIEWVTEATIFGRRCMRRCRIIDLASGERTIMAGITALTVDLGRGVIKGRRFKARGLMANAAIFAGGHVGAGLADDGIAIVTGHTVVGDTRVIIFGTGKGRGVMTIRTVPINTIDYCGRMNGWLDSYR